VFITENSHSVYAELTTMVSVIFIGQWFIVLYDSANKQDHNKKPLHWANQPQYLVNIRTNENAMTLWLISVNKEGCCVISDWWGTTAAI